MLLHRLVVSFSLIFSERQQHPAETRAISRIKLCHFARRELFDDALCRIVELARLIVDDALCGIIELARLTVDDALCTIVVDRNVPPYGVMALSLSLALRDPENLTRVNNKIDGTR